MEFDKLMLALRGLTAIMHHRDNIDRILNLAAEGKVDEANVELGTFLGELYLEGVNAGVEHATEKLESRLREAGIL